MNRPALMGIVNATPDSFSDGGRLGGDAVAYAERLVKDGADILDLGGESTRPGAEPVTPDAEWARLQPLLDGILNQSWRPQVRLSIDTRHAQTAQRAMDMGVEIINDVSGLRAERMAETLRDHECDIVVMHSLTLPVDPSVTWPADCDPIAEMLVWKESVTTYAEQRGIAAERLIYDPGIGFGKTGQQSLALIEGAGQLVTSGGRWLVGHSRKSFMAMFTDAPPMGRDGLTLAFSAKLARAGVPYLRIHDVISHRIFFDQACI